MSQPLDVDLGGRVFRLPFLWPMAAAERAALRLLIRKQGLLKAYPIALARFPDGPPVPDVVIDGANRIQLAGEDGINHSRVPTEYLDVADIEDAARLSLDLNLTRRHWTDTEKETAKQHTARRIAALTAAGKTQREVAAEVGVSQSAVSKNMAKTTGQSDSALESSDQLARQAKVAELAKAGQSQRQIAKVLQVAKGTVSNDLAALEAKGEDVQPPGGKTTGKDGKQRPARKPGRPKNPKNARREETIAKLKKGGHYPGAPAAPEVGNKELLDFLASVAAFIEPYRRKWQAAAPLFGTLQKIRDKVTPKATL